MSIHLESKDLVNAQQMEVAVNGPDGATHLILCTGVVELGSFSDGTYTFLVGPEISRRQFVGAIASGAPATVQVTDRSLTEDNDVVKPGDSLILMDASYDDKSGRVKVSAGISSRFEVTRLAITYNVSILAELPAF